MVTPHVSTVSQDSPPGLFYWSIYDNSTIRQVNISVSDCGYKNQKPDTVSQWRVMCPEELEYKPLSHKPGDLSQCKLYFGAMGGEAGEDQYLCVMDIDSGIVKPLSPKAEYVNAAQVQLQWHPYGALYTAGQTHNLGPAGGEDLMLFSFATQVGRVSVRWWMGSCWFLLLLCPLACFVGC